MGQGSWIQISEWKIFSLKVFEREGSFKVFESEESFNTCIIEWVSLLFKQEKNTVNHIQFSQAENLSSIGNPNHWFFKFYFYKVLFSKLGNGLKKGTVAQIWGLV